MHPTFAERFCRHHGVSISAYRHEMMRRALYPHARCVRPFLLLLDQHIHSLDEEFVDAVGRITQLRELATKVEDFVWHPVNFTFLRQNLRLRVSVGRLRKLIIAVMGIAPAEPSAEAAPQSSTVTRRLA